MVIEMNSFLLETDDTIVNVVEYAGAPPSHDGGLRVVEARDGLTYGDTYTPAPPAPREQTALEGDVALLKRQVMELLAAVPLKV